MEILIFFLSGFIFGVLTTLFLARQLAKVTKQEIDPDDWWKKGEENPLESE